MSVPIRVAPQAMDDVRQGKRYFDGLRSGLGTAFVDEVLATLDRIGDMPFGYAKLEDEVRAVGLRRFGYVVYYRVSSAAAEVLAVLHGGRPPEIWQARVTPETG